MESRSNIRAVVKRERGGGGLIQFTYTGPNSFLIGWLAEAPCPVAFASGHALGAVFNQLVRSRAQLLVAE